MVSFEFPQKESNFAKENNPLISIKTELEKAPVLERGIFVELLRLSNSFLKNKFEKK